LNIDAECRDGVGMTQQAPQRIVTIAEIEHALVVMAYVVRLHGPKYAPLMYRLKAELEKARREDPLVEADNILMAYTREGGVKAIR
jgi:TPP-dependent pyruvate/acetoin dehydrogenase alpha subunit